MKNASKRAEELLAECETGEEVTELLAGLIDLLAGIKKAAEIPGPVSYAIRYEVGDSEVFYSVEHGSFVARGECTTFKRQADANMIKLRLHEERAMSLQKLKVVMT